MEAVRYFFIKEDLLKSIVPYWLGKLSDLPMRVTTKLLKVKYENVSSCTVSQSSATCGIRHEKCVYADNICNYKIWVPLCIKKDCRENINKIRTVIEHPLYKIVSRGCRRQQNAMRCTCGFNSTRMQLKTFSDKKPYKFFLDSDKRWISKELLLISSSKVF